MAATSAQKRRVMKPLNKVVWITCIGGVATLCAWLGYQSGLGSDIPDATGSPENGPSVSVSESHTDYRKYRRAIFTAARSVTSDRTDEAYVALNKAMADFPEEKWPNLLVDVENMASSSARDYLLRRIIRKLAARYPDGMFDYCLENDLSDHMGSVFEALAKSDAGAAWRKVEEFMRVRNWKEATRKNYVTIVFQEWAKQDLGGAFEQALAMDDRINGHAVRGFGAAMAEEHREAFLEWVLSIPEVPETFHRENFVRFATKWMARQDRDAALRWLYLSQVSDDWFTQIEIEIALPSFHTDPQTSAEWLYATIRSSQPNDRFEKLDHIAANWRDREAAAIWFDSLGEHEWAERVRSD